jgi:hypothetical protein
MGSWRDTELFTKKVYTATIFEIFQQYKDIFFFMLYVAIFCSASMGFHAIPYLRYWVRLFTEYLKGMFHEMGWDSVDKNGYV